MVLAITVAIKPKFILSVMIEGGAKLIQSFIDEGLWDEARVITNTTLTVPQGVPWFPKDVESWPVRWVALHLIEELTRHAGHADIVRESIDRATMYKLLVALDG